MRLADRTNKFTNRVINTISDYSNPKMIRDSIDKNLKEMMAEQDYVVDKGSKVEFIKGIDYAGVARAFATGGKERVFRYIIEIKDELEGENLRKTIYHEIVHIGQMANVALANKPLVDRYKYSWLDLETVARTPKDKGSEADYYKDTQEIAAHAYEVAKILRDKAMGDGRDINSMLNRSEIAKIDNGMNHYINEASPKVQKQFLKLVSEALTKMSSQTYQPRIPRRDEIRVIVDVKKVEASYSKDENFYVGENGSGAAIGTRYQKFKQWLVDYPETPIDPPNLGLTPSKNIMFGDGRHRWAVLRDMGETEIAVTIDRDELKTFKEKYGAREVTGKSVKTAKKGVEYKYSNTQLTLDDDITKSIQDFIKANIDKEDLDEEGVEDQTHITLLYGILEKEDDGRLEKAVKESGLKTVTLEGLNKFENDGRDVLIIKIEKSKELVDTEKTLKELYPDNVSKFPKYSPHLTIAYLKPGLADKYIKKFPDLFKDKDLKIKDAEFSAGGDKGITKVKIASFAEDIHIFLAKVKNQIVRASKKSNIEFMKDLNAILQGMKPVVGISKLEVRKAHTGPNKGFLDSAKIQVKNRWVILYIDPTKRGKLSTFEGWNQFQDGVEEYLSHELQHQKDHDEGKTLLDEEYLEARNEGYYFELPEEMHAYAREAVSELRNVGYTDEDILELIEKSKYIELSNNSAAFNSYLSYRYQDPEIFSDFMALIKNHINKDEQKFNRKSKLIKSRR